ncbi:MAG: hypothetical protein HQ565_08015 [Bacteroidetes bacterium]|nr:hypothetical protein [Bacteroidota bacterium]
MEKLVCDTMIWYYLGNGKINHKDLKGYQLIGTGLNISEFVTTMNLIDNFHAVKSAIKAFLDYDPEIIKMNFGDHMFSRLIDEFIPDSSELDIYLKAMRDFMDIESLADIPEENKSNALEQSEKKIKELEDYAEAVNDKLPDVRKTVKDMGSKKDHRKRDFMISHRENIKENILSPYSMQYYGSDYTELIHNDNWSDFDFFFITWDLFLKDLELSGNMKLKGNDLADLFNLVYVQPGYKYATKEKRWKNIFKQDLLLSSFFVDI